MLSALEFLLLATVINSTLFINKPREAQECYVAANNNPNKWHAMEIHSNDICKIKLQEWSELAILRYKVLYIRDHQDYLYYQDADGEQWIATLYDAKITTLNEMNALNVTLNQLDKISHLHPTVDILFIVFFALNILCCISSILACKLCKRPM